MATIASRIDGSLRSAHAFLPRARERAQHLLKQIVSAARMHANSAIDTTLLSRARPYLAVLGIALLSRVFVVSVAVLAHQQSEGEVVRSLSGIATLLHRWDAGWYESIVQNGYNAEEHATYPGQVNYAFFPVTPIVVRAVMDVSGLSVQVAGFVASTIAFAAATLVIFQFVLALGLTQRVAFTTVVFLAFAPHSFVFSALYSESFFLLFLAGAMLAMRTRRYLLSGACAAILSGVRPNGILFAVYAFAHLLRCDGLLGVLRFWERPSRFLPVALAPLGLFAYWWYCYSTTGDAFAQATTMAAGWSWSPDWPWHNLARFVLYGGLNAAFWTLGSIAYFATALLLVKYRYIEEFVFCLACFLLYWTGSVPNSLLRYSMVLFPVYVGLSCIADRHPPAGMTALAGLATVNGFLIVQFVLGRFIAI